MTIAAGRLPLAPLLAQYRDPAPPDSAALAALPGLGARFRAVAGAREEFLNDEFLDRAGDAEFVARVTRFYEACVPLPLHGASLRREAGVVRHGLAHMLRGAAGWSDKMDACLAPAGVYHVGGLGAAFWSAIAQALVPARNPGWLPDTIRGLRRLRLLGRTGRTSAGATYEVVTAAYRSIAEVAPELSAFHIDHFLCQVARMTGRELPGDEPGWEPGSGLAEAVRAAKLLPEVQTKVAEARHQLEQALAAADRTGVSDALAAVDAAGAAGAGLIGRPVRKPLLAWIRRLWKACSGDLARLPEPPSHEDLWLTAAVLHLRDPEANPVWNERAAERLLELDDVAGVGGDWPDRYRLYAEGLTALAFRYGATPAQVISALEGSDSRAPASQRRSAGSSFRGFPADAFRFLAELEENNHRGWMERQRERYRFGVRGPMVELCRALARRYVEPIMRGEQGWDIDLAARPGRALTRLCKNDFGRSVPYNTALWITFCRQGRTKDGRSRRHDAQLFVRLDKEGLWYGLRVAASARAAAERLARNAAEHGGLLVQSLERSGAAERCRFGGDEDWKAAGALDLTCCARGRSFVAYRHLSPSVPHLAGDELVGEIILTFDALLPALACAMEDDPRPILARRVGAAGPEFTERDFCRATFLGERWVRRSRELLRLKPQLILHGVPGTGKTHVARSLALLLAGGREEAVRLVQFHPAYGYEEFVEGIRVRSIEVNGRQEVTYPIEDGLLCSFAAEAARAPERPHVVVIDEINRGNLPRVFGELLYLLEYRGHSVNLAYSKRPFRLPENLYLIGTMNAADRSVALMDRALRRRFSFLEMAPDAGVLTAWLERHPPSGGAVFAGRVVRFFVRLNERLEAELGPDARVGHSHFMVADLDEERLRAVWDHHVRPVVEDHLGNRQAGGLGGLSFDDLWGEGSAPGGRKRRRGQVAARP